jgi:hypothetical protein
MPTRSRMLEPIARATSVRFGCGSRRTGRSSPKHGSYKKQDPGSRAYASAGLPGAEWWVAESPSGASQCADVELDDVDALYTERTTFGRRIRFGNVTRSAFGSRCSQVGV